MRKKDAIKLNEELFLQVEKQKTLIEELKNENAELKTEIARLKANEVVTAVSEPMKQLEEKVKTISLNRETEYGATVIGEIVVSAARYCNSLTREPSENAKELVNLILGRTEVAKAEILKLISENCDFEAKKDKIIREKAAAEDYFQSVAAQV